MEKHPAEEITEREQTKKGQLPQNIALEGKLELPSGPVALEGDKLDNKD
jgi:hypothetical protein